MKQQEGVPVYRHPIFYADWVLASEFVPPSFSSLIKIINGRYPPLPRLFNRWIQCPKNESEIEPQSLGSGR